MPLHDATPCTAAGRSWSRAALALAAVMLTTSPGVALAHPGGVDQDGWHVNTKTGKRHLHHESEIKKAAASGEWCVLARDSSGRIKRDHRQRRAFIEANPCPVTGSRDYRKSCPGGSKASLKQIRENGGLPQVLLGGNSHRGTKARRRWTLVATALAVRDTPRRRGYPMRSSFVACLALSACATVGRPISQEEIARLRPGETTIEEAVALLGAPSHTVTNHTAGTTTLVWTHGSANAFTGEHHGAALSVTFGPDRKIVPAGSASPGIISSASNSGPPAAPSPPRASE